MCTHIWSMFSHTRVYAQMCTHKCANTNMRTHVCTDKRAQQVHTHKFAHTSVHAQMCTASIAFIATAISVATIATVTALIPAPALLPAAAAAAESQLRIFFLGSPL